MFLSWRRCFPALAAVIFLIAAGSSVASAQRDAPSREPAYPWPFLDQLIENFHKIRREAAPVIGRMDAVRREFASSQDRRGLLEERNRLRMRLGELLREGEEIIEQYRNTQKFIHVRALTKGMQQKFRDARTQETSEVLMRIMRYDEEFSGIKKEMTGLYSAAANDDQAMAAIQERLAKESNFKLIAGIAGLSVFAALGLSFWITSRRPPMPTLDARPYEEAPKMTANVLPPPPGQAALQDQRRNSSDMPERLGDNYRVLRELGRGGMGVVYEALDETLQRKVAIKRMRGELLESGRELEQFLSEARLVASLKHPCLVEIYAIHKESEEVYLIFEYVDGWTLQQLLDKRKRLPPQQANFVLRQIASALDYAHSQKVIHRDLKPSNVMLTQKGLVKVMDFGIAYQAKKTAARMTRADAWGTPPYMAPEQELGSVSKESDIFSLGVCYYEMLTGRLPFEGPNYLAQKREMRYPPASTLSSDTPPGLDAILKRALSAEASERFHSGSELVKAVEGVVGAV